MKTFTVGQEQEAAEYVAKIVGKEKFAIKLHPNYDCIVSFKNEDIAQLEGMQFSTGQPWDDEHGGFKNQFFFAVRNKDKKSFDIGEVEVPFGKV